MTGARTRLPGSSFAALATAIVVMGLGGLMTESGTWHQSLVRPDWQPAGWLFAPVWGLIFTLAVIAFSLAWQRAPGAARPVLIAVYAINAVLNVLWSALFFQLQRPDWAFFDIAALWLSIVSLIATSMAHAQVTGLLLAPYLLWVSFAALINLEIVRHNGPFG